MRVAEELRRTNIAEYLLYMWQVEDLLRANRCDMDRVRQTILPAFAEADRSAEDKWLSELCSMMLTEGVAERGHLQINKNILTELTDLHLSLLASPKFPFYSAAYYNALPFIVELRGKEGSEVLPEIETCFNALYGKMLLQMKHKDISPDTEHALAEITTFVGMLSDYYIKNRDEGLDFGYND